MPSEYRQYIDDECLKAMTYKILKEEQDNLKTGIKTHGQMVDEILRIIQDGADKNIKEKK